MKFQIGAMTVGDILDRSLKLLLGRFGTFYAINFLMLLPILLYELALPVTFGADRSSQLVGKFLENILYLIFQPLATAASLHVVAQAFVGRNVGVGEALSFALTRFLPLLGTSLLVGLVVGVGLILCIVPGIIFALWYSLTAQAIVVEKLSGNTAMERSKKLTEGYRGRVFGIILLVYVLIVVIAVVVGMLSTFLPAEEFVPRQGAAPDPSNPFAQLDGTVVVSNWTNFLILHLLIFMVQLFANAFMAIALTLTYFDLRIRKEGYDLEVAASQMAEKPDLDFQS